MSAGREHKGKLIDEAQTVEILQAAVKEINRQSGQAAFQSSPWPQGVPSPSPGQSGRHEGTMPADSSTIVAEAAEEIFNNGRQA